MALIKCPECGKEMSDKASSCGHPINNTEIEIEQDRVNIRDKNKGER